MRARLTILALLALATVAAASAGAIHFYRGPGGGCTPADGALGAAPTTGGATVTMLHNSFLDADTASPVTMIAAGESVTWVWASAHCHSARIPGAWTSGFHYPTQAPESPRVVAGFDYPVPDSTPTLSYTRTFDAPGTYAYSCEHHAAIGMVGVVIVE